MNYKPKLRVTIAVPTGDMMHSETAMCLLAMVKFCTAKEIDVVHANTRTSLVAVARNNLVAIARHQQSTHILFVDSDMVFQPVALAVLLQANRDIIGAAYPEKRPPYHICCFREDMSRLAVEDLQFETPFQVGAIGTGMLLIKMSVFDDMDRHSDTKGLPYFDTGMLMIAHDPTIWGEDIVFCHRVRNVMNKKVWVHPVLSRAIGHLSTQPVGIPTLQGHGLVKGNA